MQAGKNRHEHICESLELFGREVLPEFDERDEALVKAKTDRLAPVVEAALARRTAPPALTPGYHFPAIPRKWADDTGSAELKEWLEQFADNTATGDAASSFNLLG